MTILDVDSFFRNIPLPKTIDVCINNYCLTHHVQTLFSPTPCEVFKRHLVLETGLFELHKLTTTVLQQYFPKLKPEISEIP